MKARHLKALPSGNPQQENPPPSHKDRQFAPNAPASPGTVPLDLARRLRSQESVIWWNQKKEISKRAVLYTLALGAVCLAGVTLFAPEFWAQPLAELWKPALVPMSPALIVFLREKMSIRSILVTDNSVLEIDRKGRSDRIAFRSIRRVRRDLLTGGMLLEGKNHRVRIPPMLLHDAQAAIASQTHHRLGSGEQAPDDPLGWLPR